MQSRTAPPRQDLTAAQVDAALLEGPLAVTAGLDVVQADGTLVQDITDDLLGGIVERNNHRTVHGTCTLQLTRQLAWQSVLVRPRMTMTGPDGTAVTFWLGVYELDTPEGDVDGTPTVWTVEGYDLMVRLDDDVAETYTITAGTGYLDAIRTLLDDAGLAHAVDGAAEAETLSTDRSWPIGDTTRLRIVNDLLDAVGYRGVWIDQTGRARCQRYQRPADRPTEFTYLLDGGAATVLSRETSRELWDVPNRWVVIRDDPDPSAGAPTVGDGIAVVVNQSDGIGSIDSRGRTITRVERLDAASQQTLEDHAQLLADGDRAITRHLALQVDPNPLHLHWDIVGFDDPANGIIGPWIVDEWRLPLDGSPMTVAGRKVVT